MTPNALAPPSSPPYCRQLLLSAVAPWGGPGGSGGPRPCPPDPLEGCHAAERRGAPHAAPAPPQPTPGRGRGVLPGVSPAAGGGDGGVGQAFATFLRLEVAQGAATPDTQRGYWSQVRAWAAWCQAQACCVVTASAPAMKAYRQASVETGYQAASIAHKLAVLRRLYAAAIAQGLRADNPALGVHPPRDRRAAELLPCLAEGELVGLLALLAVQGLRTVEVARANVEDLYHGDPVVLRVRGKTRDRVLPLRPDLAAVLQAYLAARGAVARDAACATWSTATCARRGSSGRGSQTMRCGTQRPPWPINTRAICAPCSICSGMPIRAPRRAMRISSSACSRTRRWRCRWGCEARGEGRTPPSVRTQHPGREGVAKPERETQVLTLRRRRRSV
jgi:hypothetical protein